MKLNLCAGGNILQGWVNTDLCYADPGLRIDITKPMPWPDNSAEMILIEHGLEHVSGPDALRCLDECFRVLKPGGVMRVCVPAIDRPMTKELARDLVLNHGHLIFFSFNSLNCILALAGFSNIKRCTRRECDGHHRAIGMERDEIETLRMEAIK